MSKACAGESENRIGDGRRDWWDANFSRAAHFPFAGHNVHLNLRHLVHPKHRVVVKVSLLHASFLERDLAIEGSGEAKDDTTLHLSAYDVGVHHRAAINRADNPVDAQFPIFGNRDFGYLRDIASERFMDGQTASTPVRHRFSPAGFFGNQLEHALVARMLVEQRAAEFIGVLAGRMSQFVHESLDDERGVTMPHGSPYEHWHATGCLLPFYQQIGDVVRQI